MLSRLAFKVRIDEALPLKQGLKLINQDDPTTGMPDR